MMFRCFFIRGVWKKDKTNHFLLDGQENILDNTKYKASLAFERLLL